MDEGTMDPEMILGWFDKCNAVWIHDGNSKKPHAELTSGLCSNGYFNCSEVLKYPYLNENLAQELVRKLKQNGVNKVDWTIGSPYSAITFSYEVAKAIGAVHAFTEKDPTDQKGKRMIWRRMTIPAGATILQIEELVTTSGTFKEVRRAVEEGNTEPVNFLPEIGILIHRPSKLPVDYGEQKAIALIEKEVWTVSPENCPLCKAGSLRYRPKSHWRELTGKN
ncbi:hypothetical protein KKA49_00095 [Patescibacteria group bacterium]|nr:hypothetical protein [Patescibacteria group bacterium]MBU2579967.1 hypothetical protein [Patescibacteria group bacterium]